MIKDLMLLIARTKKNKQVQIFCQKMNADLLHLTWLSGNTLNLEETSSLLPSISIVQDSQNFSQVSFWGKIYGTQKDYLIVQGVQDNLFKKKFLYRCAPQYTHIQSYNIVSTQLGRRSDLESIVGADTGRSETSTGNLQTILWRSRICLLCQ